MTAVQNKEKSAEREIVNYLEEVADELYPETIESEVKEDGDEDMGVEEMLKKELEGLKGNQKKSNRFSMPVMFPLEQRIKLIWTRTVQT